MRMAPAIGKMTPGMATIISLTAQRLTSPILVQSPTYTAANCIASIPTNASPSEQLNTSSMAEMGIL